MRLALAQENMAEADKILSEINPASKEYPKALTVMGFAHWYKYKMAKKQIDAEKARRLKPPRKEGEGRQARQVRRRPQAGRGVHREGGQGPG